MAQYRVCVTRDFYKTLTAAGLEVGSRGVLRCSALGDGAYQFVVLKLSDSPDSTVVNTNLITIDIPLRADRLDVLDRQTCSVRIRDNQATSVQVWRVEATRRLANVNLPWPVNNP